MSVTRAEHDALVVRVASLERRIAERDAPHEHDDALLLAIAASTAGRTFTARALVAHADVDPALKHALDQVLVDTAKQCGKRLARLAKRHHGDLRLTRVQRSGMWRWRVALVALHAGNPRPGRLTP